jgi:hypothetical protein
MNTQEILKLGVIFVGIVLIVSAINNLRNSYTYGLTGKGRFERKDEPVHFMMLFAIRLLLGGMCLLLAYSVPV